MAHGGFRVGAGAKPVPDDQYMAMARARMRANSRDEDRGWRTPCWIWQRRLKASGYSQTEFRGKCITAHRAAYIAFKGPIPDGLQIDHLCRTKACCNPDHLEAVTSAENLRRAHSYDGRTECRRGHALNEKTVGVYPASGRRFCRICRNVRKRERRAAAAGSIVLFHKNRFGSFQERNHA